jgi:cold shock CspA family protein
LTREAGTVVLWKDSKGFGQIRAEVGDIVFFTNLEIEGTLNAGQRVEFTRTLEAGRMRARHVVVLDSSGIPAVKLSDD